MKESPKRITLTVGPLGHDFSVMRGQAYYGRYPSRTKATQAAEDEAEELRRDGYEVSIKMTIPRRPDWRLILQKVEPGRAAGLEQ